MGEILAPLLVKLVAQVADYNLEVVQDEDVERVDGRVQVVTWHSQLNADLDEHSQESALRKRFLHLPPHSYLLEEAQQRIVVLERLIPLLFSLQLNLHQYVESLVAFTRLDEDPA